MFPIDPRIISSIQYSKVCVKQIELATEINLHFIPSLNCVG